MSISDVPLVVRQKIAYVVQGALIVVAGVRPVWYGSDMNDTGSVPVSILEVCWDSEFGDGWSGAEWVLLFGLQNDGFGTNMHHVDDKCVNTLYKFDVFVVSMCEPFDNVDSGVTDLLDAPSGGRVRLLIAIGIGCNAYVLVDVSLRGVALDFAASGCVRASRNNALQQKDNEIAMELHLPRFS